MYKSLKEIYCKICLAVFTRLSTSTFVKSLSEKAPLMYGITANARNHH